jgi:tetratricopeptide (TPR) repeat protein
MIQEVFISGQLAKAIYRDDKGSYFVFGTEQVEPRAANPGEIAFLLSLQAEFRQIPVRAFDLPVLHSQLVDEERKSTALFLILSGLDSALSPDTRADARNAAEELLLDAKVAQFVNNRLLSRPAPAGYIPDEKGFDPKSPIVSSIYREVFDNQDTIDDVASCWQAAVENFFPTPEDSFRAAQTIIDAGFLAAVVRAIEAQKIEKVNDLVVSYALEGEVRSQIPQAARLLNDFRTRLLASFPPTVAWRGLTQEDRRQPERAEPFTDLIYSFNYFDPSRRRSRLSAHESVTRVMKQINAIKELLFSGNVRMAEKYFIELLQFNLEHGEREHVAMTLCNLASIALQANELEMAERLSDSALRLGIEDDPVIYITHAEVLRWSARFGDALEEYAQIKDRFPTDHHGFSAYGEVLKDMGRFQDSLEAYKQAMEKWPEDPVPRNGHAGVLQAMGRREDAAAELKLSVRVFNDVVSRTAYATVLSRLGRFGTALSVAKTTMKLFPKDVSGFLSYARTLRQAWMLEESLTAYELVVDRFPDVPHGLAGKAEILKRMDRLNDALAVYDRLVGSYPNNPMAKAGRASILILLGATEDAFKELANTRLLSESDWLAHYLVSVSYLRAGDLDTAISRMTHGYHTSPWQYARTRYAMGLGVAMLRKRMAAEAVRVLERDASSLDYSRNEQRIVLLGHAYAELGNTKVSTSLLQRVAATQNRVVVDLSQALISCYRLDSNVLEVPDTWRRIESRELFLAVSA